MFLLLLQLLFLSNAMWYKVAITNITNKRHYFISNNKCFDSNQHRGSYYYYYYYY